MPEFKSGDIIRVKPDNPKMPKKYWRLTGVIASRETFLVRKIFRTDYLVIMHGSLEAATFKESDIELYRP
ncbi:hypothetical protein SEA_STARPLATINUM_118 [Streptomyces phage StarPlatinum]|uniref:Uncharacterized protein n=1 Tax=Streptomyces phage StarPlatinum TaxID=2283265 RepID=A0A345M8N9_9CAUD|nr:hypothetical protein HWB77_gp177 [Streptomyces phage StarPlatinum]AXH66860.1 hypothetical protein SEA_STARPLATINUM_118 [Streptomyces phage StarPlatinum]